MASECYLSNSDSLHKEPNINMDCGGSLPVQGPGFTFVILFNWDESVQKPFKMFPRKAFPEIKEVYLERELPDEYRIKKLRPLKPLPNQVMSLFGKVESGMFHKKKHLFHFIFKTFCPITTDQFNFLGCKIRIFTKTIDDDQTKNGNETFLSLT